MSRAYIGIGANLGEARAAIEAAMNKLARFGRVLRRSSLYRSAPWGGVEQSDFINAVALLETAMSPRELLCALQTLERELGRVPGQHWGPRAIDLDILTYDEVRIDEPDLQVPHPLMLQRAFVLVPLAEIDPRYAAARDALGSTQRIERVD